MKNKNLYPPCVALNRAMRRNKISGAGLHRMLEQKGETRWSLRMVQYYCSPTHSIAANAPLEFYRATIKCLVMEKQERQQLIESFF